MRIVAIMVCLLGLTALGNAAPVTVSGTVLGPDGQAMPGCRVVAVYYSAEPEWVDTEGVTDATGRFSFTLDVGDDYRRISVLAIREGFALDWVAVKSEEPVTLRLGANPVPCTGTVINHEGEPIGGAIASVRTLIGSTAISAPQYLSLHDEALLSDTTNEQGRFEIAGLPPEVQVHLKVSAEGWAQLWAQSVRPASEHRQRFVLQPEATISGQITHEGQAVAGVKVSCGPPGPYGGSIESVSRQDGSYTLKQVPFGFYYIRLEPPEGLTARPGERIRVNTGENVTGADVQLTPGGLIQGTVTEDETGRPLAGVQVGTGLQGTTTDEAGNYTLRAAPGTARVYVSSLATPRMETVGDRYQEVEVVEGETVTGVDFVMREYQPQMLRGQVLLPDGQPAAGVKIGIVGSYWGQPGMDRFKTSTDAEGRFELDVGQQLGPPAYRPTLAVLARDVERGLAGLVAVPDREKPVEIRLAQGGYVVAEVVDTEGRPVADVAMRVYVSVRRDGGHMRVSLPVQGTSDDQGRIRIGPLPAGVPLRMSPGDETEMLAVEMSWGDVGEITLSPGEEYQLPRLELNLEGRTVRGWVGDRQQQPVAGAVVFGIGERQYRGHPEPAYTDEQGYFELTGLSVRGEVTIVAAHPTGSLFATEHVDPDWGFEPGFILQPAGSVIGRLMDRQGQPVYDATVTVESSTVSYGMSEELRRRLHTAGFTMETYTDHDGKWRMDGLIPGIEYRVSVRPRDPNAGHASARFTATAGQTEDLGEMVLEQQERGVGMPGPLP